MNKTISIMPQNIFLTKMRVIYTNYLFLFGMWLMIGCISFVNAKSIAFADSLRKYLENFTKPDLQGIVLLDSQKTLYADILFETTNYLDYPDGLINEIEEISQDTYRESFRQFTKATQRDIKKAKDKTIHYFVLTIMDSSSIQIHSDSVKITFRLALKEAIMDYRIKPLGINPKSDNPVTDTLFFAYLKDISAGFYYDINKNEIVPSRFFIKLWFETQRTGTFNFGIYDVNEENAVFSNGYIYTYYSGLQLGLFNFGYLKYYIQFEGEINDGFGLPFTGGYGFRFEYYNLVELYDEYPTKRPEEDFSFSPLRFWGIVPLKNYLPHWIKNILPLEAGFSILEYRSNVKAFVIVEDRDLRLGVDSNEKYLTYYREDRWESLSSAVVRLNYNIFKQPIQAVERVNLQLQYLPRDNILSLGIGLNFKTRDRIYPFFKFKPSRNPWVDVGEFALKTGFLIFYKNQWIRENPQELRRHIPTFP